MLKKESQEYLGPHEPGLQQVISTYYFPTIEDADNFDNTNHDPTPTQPNENRQSTVHKDPPATRKYHYYPTNENEDSILVQESENDRITTGRHYFHANFGWIFMLFLTL